ncbi:MAG: nuclear transport factor 2 family protein [Ferruginibacter sp.]
MKRRSFLITAIAFLILQTACEQNSEKNTGPHSAIIPSDTALAKKQIVAMLDSFNMAAASADYERYFNYFTEDATFNGTDATENWNKETFKVWAKPYFDKKTTWNFTALVRNIYFGKQADIAWFDELLNTQMKICRGSGVVIKQGNEWKVQQYVLSTTIPNNHLDAIIKMKAATEDSIINKLAGK